MAETAPARLMLQFKAKLSHAIVVAGQPGPDSGGVVTVPPGRLSLDLRGETKAATPLLAWLGQSSLEAKVVINTETDELFVTVYLDD